MRQPVTSLVLAVGILIAAASASVYFDINTGTSGVSELPSSFRAKQGFEAIRDEFGFGMAVAIVRSVLVPSTMKILGDKNWYLPGFLEWLPVLRTEGSGDVVPPLAEASSSGVDSD